MPTKDISNFIGLGERIRTARLAVNKTQREIAKELNLPYSTYSNYENGNRVPKMDLLRKIASTLNVSIEQLLGYEKERVIIPERLKIIETNDPEAKDIRYKIEATDAEAYEMGLKIFNDAGAGLTLRKRFESAFDCMNEAGQVKAVYRVEELARMPENQKE